MHKVSKLQSIKPADILIFLNGVSTYTSVSEPSYFKLHKDMANKLIGAQLSADLRYRRASIFYDFFYSDCPWGIYCVLGLGSYKAVLVLCLLGVRQNQDSEITKLNLNNTWKRESL